MRTFARFFSLGCGAIVIVIAARYGFKTSDNDFDGGMWAFTYGAVTLAGLFGHALGVRAWPNSRLVGALVFAASAFALLISLSNSIGAMAGRGNVQQAERMRVADIVRDARRSLKRAEDEREGLKFTPADGAAVAAAKAKADAATLDKDAAHRDYDAAKQASDTECLIRGKICLEKEKLTAGNALHWHEREQAEASALAALENATQNKAMTDHAAKLDADIAALREKIEKAGPILEANSQGSALARLFGLPDTKAATLSTYQNLAMAVVIEFLIAISLVASEVIGLPEKGPAPAGPGSGSPERRREYRERNGQTCPADRSGARRQAAQTLPRSAQAAADYIAAQSDRQRGADNGRHPCARPRQGGNRGPVRGLFESVRGGRQAVRRGKRLSSRPGRVVQNAQHQDRSNGYRRVFAEGQALSHNRERQRLTSR